MKTIKDIQGMKGKRALVRVDFNVPLKGKKIIDTRRIDASFATIRALQKKGLQVLLLAHLGDGTESLRPVATYLAKHFDVHFVTAPIVNDHKKGGLIERIPHNTVVLFENIRRYKGEEKNEASFSKALSLLGDIFVNDAFSVSHRKHASVVGIARYLPSYAGLQLEKEIKNLSLALGNKKHPFLFILGGAKFSTKIPLLKRFVGVADQVVIAGAILNSVLKTAGFEVGGSVVEDGFEKEIKKILSSPKVLLPIDVVVTRAGKRVKCSVEDIEKKDVIEDIGPRSIDLISQKINSAKLIVWNGPTGWYERGFTEGTIALAKAIKDAKGFAVIGGGDTGAVVEKVVGETKHLFVSTGGGATLDFLANGTLPGIQCIK